MTPIKTRPTDHLGAPFCVPPKWAHAHGFSPAEAARGIVAVDFVAEATESYGAGTHDGMRDGAFSGSIRRIERAYYWRADWLAEGRPDPMAPEVAAECAEVLARALRIAEAEAAEQAARAAETAERERLEAAASARAARAAARERAARPESPFAALAALRGPA